MSKTILFSPIGGNDPVSSANEADGSMLHICRHYKPDIVYLYLSAEMVERSHQDDRYRYCIQKLGEKLGHNFEVHLIERETLEDVHEYDFYYQEFHEILRDIEDSMDSSDRLLINIASGTPAMKSELLVAAVLSEFHIMPIQVVTPTRKINTHKGMDSDYDPEYYWEINRDNEEGAENRCIEVKCPNLVATIKKNIIMRHILSYDYTAALSLANEIKAEMPAVTIRMLEAAIARMQLNLRFVTELEKEHGFRLRRRLSSMEDILFEYALSLHIKLKRKEYGDFIRAISPLLTDLFTEILKKSCGIDIIDYCVENKERYFLNRKKMEQSQKGQEILGILDQEFSRKGGYKDGILTASNMEPILVAFLKDKNVIEDVKDIRMVEDKLRNILAHEITSINEDRLQKLLEKPFTMQQILDIIKRLIVAAKLKVTMADWNSYEEMNQSIIDTLI